MVFHWNSILGLAFSQCEAHFVRWIEGCVGIGIKHELQ